MKREMSDVIAEMQSSGSIYFQKSLTQSAIYTHNPEKRAKLALPTRFVQDYGDRIEKWVILRAHSAIGKTLRPWAVRVKVQVKSYEVVQLEFADGWTDFALGYRLEEGDSLIFLLKEGVRSEFEVHMFRGAGDSPYFPVAGSFSDEAEEDEAGGPVSEEEEDDEDEETWPHVSDDETNFNVHTPVLRSRVQRHQLDEQVCKFPAFRKLLTATSIQRSDRNYMSNSGQFEFPLRFVESYGAHLQYHVKLQGVYENSPVYDFTCCRCIHKRGEISRLYFRSTEWGEFVRDNGLREGHELQFTLTAHSHFEVRKVHN